MSKYDQTTFESSSVKEYQITFVQATPRYGIKMPGEEWKSIEKSLTTDLVLSHLRGQCSVASLARWYPKFGAIDIDHEPPGGIDKLRAALSMDDSNSMLCTSESEGHYHLLFIPEYNEKPPTRRLLQRIVSPLAIQHKVEFFPQENRTFRLPFGPQQECIDPGKYKLDWQDRLYWFKKLDPVQIDQLPGIENDSLKILLASRDSDAERLYQDPSAYSRGKDLFREGLQESHSRTTSQFYVLYYLWRIGCSQQAAIKMTREWIGSKHNNYSDTIASGRWRIVDGDIKRQADRIWSTYERKGNVPDAELIRHDGWTTKNDLLEILVRTDGNFPSSRFLYQLVKYMYPRTLLDPWVAVHSKKLQYFAPGSGYLDFLDRMSKLDILDRKSGYRTGAESKNIRLLWNYDRTSPPFLIDGRSPTCFDDALIAAFTSTEIISALKSSGLDSRIISNMRRTFVKNAHAIQ